MRRALMLAQRGLGRVEPNPVVGAVVVRRGKPVGQGYHRYFGGPHAEVYALEAAGKNARGATLYVTLEPCCHWGKTPPCTDAVLAAGIARVVVATPDPFARVRGKGIRTLRIAGLQVDVGLLKAEAQRVNGPFFTRLAHGRPWVIAKWAQSLDGAIATAAGESKWISGPASRSWVHKLRGRVDGIVVGIGTALADDPLLMARPENPCDLRRVATRIVLDRTCRLPVDCQLMRTVGVAPVMVVHAPDLSAAARRRQRLLAARGAMTVAAKSIEQFLRHLGEREYTNLLIEGGPTLTAAFLDQGPIDEYHIFQAGILIPGGRPAVGGLELAALADAPRLELAALERIGDDFHITAYPVP